MGEQISVLEMARNLIRLSGLVPDKDIPLTYLGCRPGEKLTEELVAGHETVESTAVQKVLCIRPDPARNFGQLSGLVARLEESAAEGNVSKVLLVPASQVWALQELPVLALLEPVLLVPELELQRASTRRASLLP